jgi:hypothetical protein
MWPLVQADFERLIAAKIYRALLEDSVYRAFLVSAGVKLNELADFSIPSSLKKNFLISAKVRAHIVVAEIERSGALQEKTVGAKLCVGPLVLYRLWDSSAPERRQGIWWFEPNVIQVCKQNTPRSPQARKEWLRAHLAISRDWSNLDRMDYISIGAKDEVPAIVGAGNPMRVYSPGAISTKASPNSTKPLPLAKAKREDYWKDFGKFFPGGIRQTILPFIPLASGIDLNAFLNKG